MSDLEQGRQNSETVREGNGLETQAQQPTAEESRRAAENHLIGGASTDQVEVKTNDVKKLCTRVFNQAAQPQGSGGSEFGKFVNDKTQRDTVDYRNFGKLLHIEREMIISEWLTQANGSLAKFQEILENAQKESNEVFQRKTVKDEQGRDVLLLARVNLLQSRYLQTKDQAEQARISKEITKIYNSLTESERQSLLKYRAATVALERVRQLKETTNQLEELKARLPTEGCKFKLGEHEYTLTKENWDEQIIKIRISYLVTTTLAEIDNVFRAPGGRNQARQVIDYKSQFERDVIVQIEEAVKQASGKSETQASSPTPVGRWGNFGGVTSYGNNFPAE